jgi:hypothetical protein
MNNIDIYEKIRQTMEAIVWGKPELFPSDCKQEDVNFICGLPKEDRIRKAQLLEIKISKLSNNE